MAQSKSTASHSGTETTHAHSVASRAAERDRLTDDVTAFLERGGKVQQVPRSFRADPPKKPENNYGRGSI